MLSCNSRGSRYHGNVEGFPLQFIVCLLSMVTDRDASDNREDGDAIYNFGQNYVYDYQGFIDYMLLSGGSSHKNSEEILLMLLITLCPTKFIRLHL